jgi:hypothetical protein
MDSPVEGGGFEPSVPRGRERTSGALNGAAAGGIAEVKKAIDIFRNQIDVVMGQIGCSSLDQLGPFSVAGGSGAQRMIPFLPRRIPPLRAGKAAPRRRARFEPFHVAAYVKATASDRRQADFPAAAVCFVATYRNLARPIREEPRMMPRTAITQIARMIGRELQSGVGPSEEALAVGPILAEAGATKEIVGSLLAGSAARQRV